MDILGFALAVLLIELTPGPNMAWLAGLAATEGRRCGLSAVWGVAIGLMINGVVAALGLATIVQNAPYIWSFLRYAGAAMMLWLAIDAWRGANGSKRVVPPESTARRAFLTGALMNVLNPKAYIFFLVVAPQFMRGQTLDIQSALLLSAISVSIATIIHFAIVMAGTKAHAWLSDPARTRTVRRLFAALMLAVAASFLMAGRP